ncbi:MAG: glycosyltransferase family 4 protein [Alphaproteobacteria bacterium]|nr:glycosyltransferase family 4 protein [Alphaproteobacteria bacterium]
MSFKLHILYDFKDAPWGGGNQFLKALREALRRQSAYAEDPAQANAILVNSHHFGADGNDLKALEALRRVSPDMALLHRVDGPVKLIRGGGLSTDRLVFKVNSLIADGTIFQTNWSRENCLRFGMKPALPFTSVMNAPDPAVFYPPAQRKPGSKIRLIATSWAANMRKGFDVYHYLDENLDFESYEMIFVGNTPIAFKNIQCLPPATSPDLADILRAQDIFITASVNDPCSNALIEGLCCGLPALARNSGGHPEILKGGGVLFDGVEDVLPALDRLAANLADYRAAIDMDSIDAVAGKYLAHAVLCAQTLKDGGGRRKNLCGFKRLRVVLAFYKITTRLKNALQRRLARGQ